MNIFFERNEVFNVQDLYVNGTPQSPIIGRVS